MTTIFHRKMQRSTVWLAALIALAFGRSMVYATVYTANFDDLSEGFAGTSFSDGGLTFSDLDQQNPGFSPYYFAIDEATATLSAPFSPPNALGFGGYAPGPGASFGRFSSCWIDFNGIGSSASLDVFSLPPGDYSQNTLSLEAWNGSTMVASVSTSFTTQSGVQYSSLALNDVAPFDRLELSSSGPVDDGTSYILVDNVSVTTVPEPNELSLLALGLVGGIYLRKRRRGSLATKML